MSDKDNNTDVQPYIGETPTHNSVQNEDKEILEGNHNNNYTESNASDDVKVISIEESTLHTDTLFNGVIPNEILNYRIICELGNGGMGQVFLAQNKNIEQTVAVKVLHPRLASNSALRKRFKQEAEMLCSLDHPNIVKFLNFVENENGVFLIMEYVEGKTLGDYIQDAGGVLGKKEAYPLMNEILEAFTYAHSQGIVHRDIKPSNIYINSEGHVKVMDFGIAQIISESSDGDNGPVMGTPRYMSPEQILGSSIDNRSDIYSLGVLFHQMLTGALPYGDTQSTSPKMKRLVITENLPRIKSLAPSAPESMQRILDKAMAKDKEKRYTDCAEMRKDVKKVLSPDPINKTILWGGIVIAFLLIAAGIFAWDYFRTKVYYYKDYVECFGVPEGIGELTEEEQQQSELSYRFEYTKHKLRRVSIVNSKGRISAVSETEHMNSRFPDAYYYYTDDGKLDYKKVYNQYEKFLFKVDYDENLRTASFKLDDEFGTAMTLGANTTNARRNADTEQSRSHISRYLLYWDDTTGRLKRVIYAAGDDNSKACDEDGIYGREYEYDEKGHIIQISFLGVDEKVKGNSFGLAIKKLTYDENDNWTSISYFSADGKPSHDGEFCPTVNLYYDKWGNRIKEEYTTHSGKPAIRHYNNDDPNLELASLNCSGFLYEYTDGCRTTLTAINGAGNPTTTGFGYSKVVYTYDENGYETSETYYDINNEKTNCRVNGGSYACIRYKVNEKGLQTEQAYFGVDDKPATYCGYHKTTYEYDKNGNATKMSNFDKKGNLTVSKDFYSVVTAKFDENNRLQSIRYLGTDNKLTLLPDNFSGIDYEYDRKGSVTKISYVGTDNRPILCADNYASVEYKYDDNGNNILIECKDIMGNLITGSAGFARLENEFAPNSMKVTKEKAYLADGSMAYYQRYEYDSTGNQTLIAKHKSDGSLYPGTVISHLEYDNYGRVTKDYATDINGNRVNQEGMSYCQQNYKYDDYGNITEQSFFTTSGTPGMDSNGAHIRIHEYNEIGQVVHEKNIGIDGKPTASNAEGVVKYDNNGNMTELAHYDGYGNPVNDTDGWFKKVQTFDKFNQQTSLTFYDTNGNLAVSKQANCAKYIVKYDSKNRLASISFYGADGKISSTAKYEYDENGQQKPPTYYDANGVQFGSSSMADDWHSAMLAQKQYLPVTIDEGIILTGIDVTTNALDLTIKLNMLSRSDMEDNMPLVRTMLQQVYDFLKKSINIPKDVALDMYVYDKNNKFVLLY